MACSGRSGRSSLIVFPVAYSTKQHGIGLHGQLERAVWQRVAVGFIGGAAHQGSFGLKLQAKTFKTLTASATISVPMPSPGRIAIFILFNS